MANTYPPPAFSFRAEFRLDGVQNNNSSFQEVSGINMQMNTESLSEGGENRYVHKLPSKAKNSNVCLKRGIISDPVIIKWIYDIIQSDMSKPIVPADIVITLQNENNEPVVKWTLSDAWPVKFDSGMFNTNKNDLAIESIEFAYNNITTVRF